MLYSRQCDLVPRHDRSGSHRSRGFVAALAVGAVFAALLTVVGLRPAQAAEADFTIYNGTTTSPILIDPSYGGAYDDRDYRRISRAVQDFRQDVAMVTGAVDAGQVQQLFADDETAEKARLARADQSKVPALATDVDSVHPGADGESTAIIIGELGQSKLIDGIVDAGKFDEAKQIKGKWEAYATKNVDHPLPGVDRALVIAGSDSRGTIFGTYSISQKIGVSPWYWFSDVPVKHQDTITVGGPARINDGPDVKYRGIFINDEQQTDVWAKAKFPTAKGTPDVNYYRHVYELMLRLDLNTLWPALKSTSTAFDAATDTGMYDTGTPVNAQAASDYGIVVSGAHSQPMLRNGVSEWPAFYEANKQKLNIVGANAAAAYDYSINKPAVLEYWREALLANRNFEDILVLGIRGADDSAAAFTPGNPYGFKDRLAMVGDAITEQRKLIKEVYGSETAVPQVLVPYKEVLDLYNEGLKAYIPDDVTLMWPEDNEGHLRQVPTKAEAARSGGNGIYYHSAYVGSPRNYTWTNSGPMSLMVDQLQRAWNSGAGRYWILNVGDIKPGEMATELFSKLAWDVNALSAENIESTFLLDQVQRDFGLTGSRAAAAADALERLDGLDSAKRAEFWGASYKGNPFPFSATSDGDEIQRYINMANSLDQELAGLAATMDPSHRSAFDQQVLYRVHVYRDMAEQYGYFWKNQLAVQQGAYGSAKVYARLSKRARDRVTSDDQHWDTLSDGKWSVLMRPDDAMLADSQYSGVASPTASVGAAAEGNTTPGAGTLRFNSASPDDQHFFDVISRNDVAEEWTVEADAPWIKLSQASGKTAAEQRVAVTVDWARLPKSATGTIHVYNAVDGKPTGDPAATFHVVADRAAVDLQGRPEGCMSPSPSCTPEYLEANGYVAIQAQHYTEDVPGADGTQWRPIGGGIAQGGDAMEAFPVTAPRVDTDFADTARLKYRVYFTSSGQFTGTLYRVPTLNEGTDDNGTVRSARTAIGIDDQVPSSAGLRGCAQVSCGDAWSQNVLRGIEPLNFTINAPTPGWHDIVVYRSDAAVLFSRIVIETSKGAVGDGLIGPPESPNNIAKGDAVQKAAIAPLPDDIANYRPIPIPPITVSVGETHALDGIGNIVTAESDNETAASVALDHGQVSITGHRVGTAEINVTSDNGGSGTFTVTVNSGNNSQPGAYQEKDGQVVIDAADALEKSAYANTINSNNGTHTWALSQNGLQVVPIPNINAKANWLASSTAEAQALLAAAPTQKVNGSDAPGTPPRLEYTVDITHGGTYYLFVNTSNPSTEADSYHVAIDGQWRYPATDAQTGTETWYGSTTVSGAALDLPPGRHTISIWAREAGFHVNQIALTTNASPGFTGFQPTSGRSG